MAKRTLVLAVLLVCGMVLVMAGSPRSGTPSADPAVLLQADEAFDRARADHGAEGFSSFLADDIVTIRPNQPLVRGKKDFLAGWNFSPEMAVRWKPEFARISDDGTMGFTTGSYKVSVTENGASKIAGTGRYITIWARQSDGSWKAVFDSGVADKAPAPPAPAPAETKKP